MPILVAHAVVHIYNLLYSCVEVYWSLITTPILSSITVKYMNVTTLIEYRDTLIVKMHPCDKTREKKCGEHILIVWQSMWTCEHKPEVALIKKNNGKYAMYVLVACAKYTPWHVWFTVTAGLVFVT